MPVISKHTFYNVLPTTISCSQMIHDWSKNCITALPGHLKKYSWGAFKFFFPLYLMQALLEWRKLGKDYLFHFIKTLIRSLGYGVCFSLLGFYYNCLSWQLTRTVYYYNLTFGTALAASLGLFVETRENRIINALVFSNMMVESMLRNIDFFNIVKLSDGTQTALFMFVSSALMYLLKNNRKNFLNIWFYKPAKLKTNNFKSKCVHGSKHVNTICRNYWLEGASKYFVFGYTISLIKVVISAFGRISKNPSLILQAIGKRDNFNFGLFLGGYVGLFRLISCVLYKKNGMENTLDPAIAGFISGITYYFKPNLHILSIGITTIFQILYHNSEFARKLHEKLPLTEMVYMCCNCFLLHNMFYCPETCPKYYMRMGTLVSDGHIDNIYNNAVTKFLYEM